MTDSLPPLPSSLMGIDLAWDRTIMPNTRRPLWKNVLFWCSVSFAALAVLLIGMATLPHPASLFLNACIAFTIAGAVRKRRESASQYLFAWLVQIGPNFANGGLAPLQVSSWPEWRGWMWEFREWETLPTLRVHQWLMKLGLTSAEAVQFIDDVESLLKAEWARNDIDVIGAFPDDDNPGVLAGQWPPGDSGSMADTENKLAQTAQKFVLEGWYIQGRGTCKSCGDDVTLVSGGVTNYMGDERHFAARLLHPHDKPEVFFDVIFVSDEPVTLGIWWGPVDDVSDEADYGLKLADAAQGLPYTENMGVCVPGDEVEHHPKLDEMAPLFDFVVNNVPPVRDHVMIADV